MKTDNVNISSMALIDSSTLEERGNRIEHLLPYRSTIYRTASMPGGVYPWHWHVEVECFQVLEGSMIYCLQGEEILFRKGDVGFLNSGILHMTKAPASENGTQQIHIFLPKLVCPDSTSELSQKYIVPLVSNWNARMMKFDADSEKAEKMRKMMDSAYAAAEGTGFGYEFAIRKNMTDVWLTFLLGMPEGPESGDSVDGQRLMLMIQYIATHYDEKITLRDIAGAAHISIKECERCFKRQIKMPPFEYLMDFRLNKAREMLMSDAGSVTEIGALCGFGSTSYFGKCFREKYSLTPREYRNIAHE